MNSFRLQPRLPTPVSVALALTTSLSGAAWSQSGVQVEVLAGTPAACGVWSPVLAPEEPFAAHDFAPVYDVARHRIVLFGGRGRDGALRRDVWQLDLSGGSTWSVLNTMGSPPSARAEYAAIYDQARDRMLVFGGTDGNPRNDLWALDLETLAWTSLATTGDVPPARQNHVAIHDPIRDRMVVLGGAGGFGVNPDPFALSLETLVWSRIAAPGPNPGTRSGHTAVYDPARDRVVVYGGLGVGQLFALDLATPAWSMLAPGGPQPPLPIEHSAVMDVARDRMMVFGGQGPFDVSNETWCLEFSPTLQWVLLSTATQPSPRRNHAAIVASDAMLILGALGSESDATWRLNLYATPAWTELVPAGKPMPERESHSAIWDSQAAGMWVWGGRGDGASLERDLWFMDPAAPAWNHVVTTGLPPPARDEHTAIFDATRQRMVLFGGRGIGSVYSDLWALDLSGAHAWSPLYAGSGPAARFGHTAVLDPLRDRMIVIAGTDWTSSFNDVWALSLATEVWTRLTATGAPPPGRYGHVAVYDPVRDRVLLIGGTDGATRFNDAWALDLAGVTTWTQLAPEGIALPGLEGHAGAYDPIADRVLVFGGTTDTGRTSLAWALSLSSTPAWAPALGDLFVPQARANHAAVWDATSNRLLITGGFSVVHLSNDVAAFSGNGRRSLALAANPPNGGALTRIPSLNCFAPGATVSITAVPASGFGFGGWTGDASGTQNPLVVTMTAAKSIVASFVGHPVTARALPSGTGAVTRVPDRAAYAPGETVTLHAVARDGGAFSHWSGDASGDANPLVVAVTGPLDIVANFVGFPVFTSVYPATSGQVDRTPNTPVFVPGSAVQLHATSMDGHGFSHWTGDITSNLNPITITVDRPLSVVANFIGHPLTTEVLPAGAGAIARVPNSPFYQPGTTVQLQAIAHTLYDFSHWTGDASGSQGTIQVLMDGPKTITAHFVAGSHRLMVSVSPPAAGNVSREPEAELYSHGRTVTLTAQPEPGQYVFAGWSGDTVTSANPLSLTMSGDRVLTAHFVGYDLIRRVTPMGSGVVSCVPDLPTLAPGTEVTLAADPSPGYAFAKWSGDASGTANPLTMTMHAHKTVTAEFRVFPLELSSSPPGSGTISKFPNRPSFALGDTVTLTAVPVPGGYVFSHWSGDLTGTQNPVTLVIDELKSITANFTGYPLTVTIQPSGFGWVATSPARSVFAPGTAVTMTANQIQESFSRWSGDAEGTQNPVTVIMDGPKNVTAHFNGYTVEVTTDPPDPRLYVVRYPDQPGYRLGSGMLLEAPTHLGLDFLNWSGDLTGTQNPIIFPITGNMHITAHFGGFPVTVGIEPPNGGMVEVHPPRPLFAPGRQVTLFAIPAPGLVFTGWTGDRAGPNPQVLSMPADSLTLVAHFAPAFPRCMEWRPVTAPNSPGPRTRHAVAFDYVRQRMILFGGLSGTFDRNNDVWVKPLSDDSSWTRIEAQGDPPEGRFSSSAIHDPVRNRVIVFGGRAPSGVKNDVWALNLDGVPTWTELAPGGPLPTTRFGASVVYDPVGDRMIVFGGNATITTRNDTWALNLSGSPEWVQLNPQNPPTGRYYANTVYDPLRNRMIVIGGRNRHEGTQLDDAWFLPLSPPPDVPPELAGVVEHWSRLSPAGYAPIARDGASSAFDPVRDRVVLACGEGPRGLLNDVAELSLIGRSAWNRPQVSDAFQPIPSSNGTMVYDAAADRVLLYGGESITGEISDDLLELSFANGLSLNVVVDPPGTGTFTISPIDPCLAPGTPVTLAAFPEPGFRFLTWENLATEENPTTWIASKHMGVVARFGPITTDVAAARTEFGIRSVFPNPTRGAVRVNYSLPAEAHVQLRVIDVSGRVIATPIDGTRAAGAHSGDWDGRMAGAQAPEGIYFLRLTAGSRTALRRVVLLR